MKNKYEKYLFFYSTRFCKTKDYDKIYEKWVMIMRFNIRTKIIILGIGQTLLLVLLAFLMSYIVYRNRLEKRYEETVDLSIDVAKDWLDNIIPPDESYSISDDRSNVYSYIVNNYNAYVSEDQNYPKETDDQEKLYDYLYSMYSDLYPSKSGTIGMSFTSTKNRETYASIAYDLTSSLAVADGYYAEAVYYDQDNDRYVMLVNTTFRFDNNDHNGDLPGSYKNLTEEEKEIIKQIENNGYYRNGTSLIRFLDLKKDNALVVRIILHYDYSQVIQSVSDFSTLLVITLVGLGIVTVLVYTLFAQWMIVGNIKKLTIISDKFKDDLLNNRELSVIDTNIKTKDEIKNLANSFETLEEEIISYTKRIQDETEIRLKMQAEIDIAAQIQMSVLPKQEYVDDKVHVSSFIEPAKKVGGDFYDYFYVDDNHLAIIISDVSGKGIPASLFMMHGKELIKSKLLAKKPLEEICFEVNNELLSENEAGLFITSFIGIIDIEKKELHFVNAGHEHPFIINEDVSQIDCKANFVLGGLDDFNYQSETIKLNDKDRLFFFTDGLSESINDQEEEFGYHRIKSSLISNKNDRNQEMINQMNKALKEFAGSQEAFDDVTMLIVELKSKHLEFKYENPGFDTITEITNRFNDYYSYFDKKVLAETGIIIDEMMNNIVSYENNERKLVVLTIDVNDEEIVLEFRSNGQEFDPTAKKDKYIEEFDENMAVGGLGISIVKQLSNTMTYKREDGFNILTIKKNLK